MHGQHVRVCTIKHLPYIFLLNCTDNMSARAGGNTCTDVQVCAIKKLS